MLPQSTPASPPPLLLPLPPLLLPLPPLLPLLPPLLEPLASLPVGFVGLLLLLQAETARPLPAIVIEHPRTKATVEIFIVQRLSCLPSIAPGPRQFLP